MAVDIQATIKNLQGRGFAVSYFETGAEAVDYLTREIRGTTVGMGGSKTLDQLGLYEALSRENQVTWHMLDIRMEVMRRANAARVYLSSANAVSQTGEVLVIDGRGNRISALTFDKDAVYFVVGVNKLAETMEAALERARNVAAPRNAARLERKTPCAVTGRCADCRSPERICRGLLVLWEALGGVGRTEIVLVNEELGY